VVAASDKEVRIFHDHQLVATHQRATRRGEWKTILSHLPPDKASYYLYTPVFCREQARKIEPKTEELITELLGERPLNRLRAVQGILRMTQKYGPERLEATCRFVEKKENVWFCGPSGVGKTHLAMALAHQAYRWEIDTPFATTARMLSHINGGRADGTYANRLRKFTKPALLILDEFCLKPLKDQEPEDLYDVINERHEKGSTILTSNRAYSEWPEALGDPLIASAVLDRLAYNSHRIEITGKSYHTKNSAKYASVSKKEPTCAKTSATGKEEKN